MIPNFTIVNIMVEIELRIGINYGAIRYTDGNILVPGPARIWVKSQWDPGGSSPKENNASTGEGLTNLCKFET
jgi:hypothetical protein